MKISITTITYNRAHIIGETIQHVLNQTYKNFEYIIIDDGSTDNTEEIIAQFNDDRIKYFKYKKSGHRSFLRNECIRKSDGELISILDSDDLWFPNKLEKQVNLFKKNPALIITFHNAEIIVNNKILNKTIYNYKYDFYKNILLKILKGEFLPYPMYTYKREVLINNTAYDESMLDGQQDFLLKIASKYQVYFQAKVLAHKIEHDENLSKIFRVSGLTNMILSINYLKNNNTLSKFQSDRFLNSTYYKIAHFYYKNEKLEDAKIFFKKSISHFYFNKKIFFSNYYLFKILVINISYKYFTLQK